MTHHSIEILPGSARASAGQTDGDSAFGPRSMRMAVPVKTEAPGIVHRTLQAATRGDHVMLDRLILRLDLTRRDQYGLFLHLHHSALKNLEADWRAEDRADFTAMLCCVQSDLQELKIETPALHPMARAPLQLSDRLGVAYVLRGSRLGARVPGARQPATVI